MPISEARSGEPTLPREIDAIKKHPLLLILVISAVVALAVACLSLLTSMGLSWPNAEAWKDYPLAYVQQAGYLRSGFFPYENYFYAYPPPFLYVLTAFSLIPGSWSAAVPLVAASALTAAPVFLLGKRVFGGRAGVIAAALTIIAPISLFYSDYLWLNPSLTTLFLMLSVYYLLEGRLDLSALLMALSIGFKQTALFAFPIVLIYLSRKTGRKAALRYLALVAAIALLYSLPWIVTYTKLYLFSFFRVPYQFWASTSEPNGYYFGLGYPGQAPTLTGNYTAYTTLQGIQTVWNQFAAPNSAASLSLSTLILFFPGASLGTYLSAELFMNSVLVFGYLVLLFAIRRKDKIDEAALVRYIMYGLLLLFALYPVYKYYIVGVIPFLALFSRNRRDVLAFFGFNLALLVIPRIAAPFLVLGLFLWMTRKGIGFGRMSGQASSDQRSGGLPNLPGEPNQAWLQKTRRSWERDANSGNVEGYVAPALSHVVSDEPAYDEASNQLEREPGSLWYREDVWSQRSDCHDDNPPENPGELNPAGEPHYVYDPPCGDTRPRPEPVSTRAGCGKEGENEPCIPRRPSFEVEERGDGNHGRNGGQHLPEASGSLCLRHHFLNIRFPWALKRLWLLMVITFPYDGNEQQEPR